MLSQNLVHGDALTMRTHDGQLITFAEWGYLGKGRFQRRDFRFDTLTRSSSFSADNPLGDVLVYRGEISPSFDLVAAVQAAREDREFGL